MIFQAKVFVTNASRDRRVMHGWIARILLRLTFIEKQQNKVMTELNEYLKNRVDGAMQKLCKYLSSEEVKTRFTSWTLDEVPEAESSWKVTENEIMKTLSRRLREVIEQWEEDNRVFANARESLAQHFQQGYNSVHLQLRHLQGAVTADNVDVPLSDALDFGLTLDENVTIDPTSPIRFPIGILAAIKSKLGNRKIKAYEADKCAFMAEKSAKYLDSAIDDSFLQTFVKDQLEGVRIFLKQIEARIPELIQADRNLCKQLMNEKRARKDIEELYKPIMDEGSHLRGELTVFAMREVRADYISSEELEWKEDISSCLGCDAFGSVYQGKLIRHGEVQTVALKVCNEVLDESNACLIMGEVELLR